MWTTWSGKASKQPGLLGVLVSVSQGPPSAQGTHSGLQDATQSGHPLPAPTPPGPKPQTLLGCGAPPGRAEASSVTSPQGAAGRLGEGRRRFAGAKAH